MFKEKENHKYLGILKADVMKQAELKKNLENKALLKNEKASRNLAQQQKSHQRNKHPRSPPCKIFKTMFKIE